jgi:hypothetical protein
MLVDVYHICLGATGALLTIVALQSNSLTLTWEAPAVFSLITAYLFGAVTRLKDY